MWGNYDSSMHGGTTGLWVVVIISLVLAVALAVILAAHGATHRPGSGWGTAEPPESEAMRVLRRRFAAGDIDEAEYLTRRDVLSSDRDGPR